MGEFFSDCSGIEVAHAVTMFEPSLAVFPRDTPFSAFDDDYAIASVVPANDIDASERGVLQGLKRRLAREVRRRKVGRAYDMALEVARVLPRNSRLLDVGCGNGFIAHHLSSLLGTPVVGIDLGRKVEPAIDYRQFDGSHFPVDAQSFDAVLLCYVLHHAQDLGSVISELRRVLRNEGLAVIYEDIPECWWDRLICRIHSVQWRKRTGACSFRRSADWRTLFNSAGFEIIDERALSRWRNLTHPVCRRFYLLKKA